MSTLASVVGYLMFAAVALAIAATAIYVTCDVIQRLINTRHDDAKRAAQASISSRLHQTAYWFLEDPPTMFLLQKIAADFVTHGWSEVSAVREEWRELRRGVKP